MKPPVEFSKDLAALLTPAQKIQAIEDAESLRNSVTSYWPYPPSKYDDPNLQVAVMFFRLAGDDKLIMMLPVCLKEENRRILYLQLKHDDIELDLQYPLEVGHQKS